MINYLNIGANYYVNLISKDVYSRRWLTLLNSAKFLYPNDIPSNIVKASSIACNESSYYTLLFLKYPYSISA